MELLDGLDYNILWRAIKRDCRSIAPVRDAGLAIDRFT